MSSETSIRSGLLQLKRYPFRKKELLQAWDAADELLLEVLYCGLCHSDLGHLNEERPTDAPPVVAGHEVVGRVVAVGDGVDRARIGQLCGLGFIAHIKDRKSHDIVTQGLRILKNLTHRGATGADPLHGDGAGVLIQIPDAFFREEMGRQGVKLPKAGAYGVGMVFLPRHGVGHRHTPSEVPYLANIWALKMLGVSHVLASAAVGSLREEIAPRDLVIADQGIDLTYRRAGTFFDELAVHVELALKMADRLIGGLGVGTAVQTDVAAPVGDEDE